MKKLRSILLTIILLCPLNLFSLEIDNLYSENILIYNLDEDKIIYSKDSDEKISIASLTKLMTVLVGIENIDDLDEKVTITKKMFENIEWDTSVAGLKIGKTYSYRDLLYGAMLPSGADATDALAISISGSTEDYVKLMNEKAIELGMKTTNFVNTTGLDDSNHYSSLDDLLILLKYALKNDTFYSIYTAKEYTSTNNDIFKRTIDDYNKKFNYNLEFIIGTKTGFTEEAGYCLSTLSNLDDTNIITLTAGASYEQYNHIKDINTIHNYLEDNFDNVSFVKEDDVLKTIKTKNSKEKEVIIYSNKTIKRYIEKPYDKEKLEIKYEGLEEVSSNTKKDTKIGTFKVYYDNEFIEEIDALTSVDTTFSLKVFLKSNISLILESIILIGLVLISKDIVKNKRRKHSK